MNIDTIPTKTANHSVANLIIIVEATDKFFGILENTSNPVNEASVTPTPPGSIAIAPISVEKAYIKVADRMLISNPLELENTFITT